MALEKTENKQRLSKRYVQSSCDWSKKLSAYHSSVPCFRARQVCHDGSAQADVALTDAPNDSKQKEHAEAPRNCPDGVRGHQSKLEHKIHNY